MEKSKIINYLKLITDELKDALSDEDITAIDCSVSTAQELVDELIDNLQGKFDNQHELNCQSDDEDRHLGFMDLSECIPSNEPWDEPNSWE